MARMEKRTVAGVEVATLSRGSTQEHFVTLAPEGDESSESLFRRAGEVVLQLAGQVVSVESLGMSAADRTSLAVLTAALGGGDVPLGWVENTRTDNLCGIHLWVVSGTPVTPIHLGGRRIGTFFGDPDCRYCRLVGLLPTDVSASLNEQTEAILRQMDTVLANGGMVFSDVLRTWFYNTDILAWYDDFNAVRNAFFREKKVFDGLMPASTGVGGRNMVGAGLIAGLTAVKAGDDGVKAFAVPSPLQSCASGYGSSFSRAVELELPDHRRLYVSGTASIDQAGDTAFVGDPEAQVGRTMDVVEAILRSRNMDWTDVTRSLAYFKRAHDAGLFDAHRANRGLPSFPAVVVENDICRDDLLFEIEVDALKTK